MSVKTTTGIAMDSAVLDNYLCSLVDCFFKILPLKEIGEPSLETYMRSLQAELLGCKSLVLAIQNDSRFLSLISILQYLIEHPECDVPFVKREVFRSISICNKLKDKYTALQEV